jgi:NAD+ synthase
MLSELISKWLFDYLKSSNLDCFVIGISGGIDSAVTSTLCAKTGMETIVVSIPIDQNENQLLLARKHMDWLKNNFKNIRCMEFDLSNIFSIFKSTFNDGTELSFANSKSRLRMTSLYQISSTNNGLVVGTGNKVEDFGIGFFTKYGDGGVDISPIADLTKTEVRELAKDLAIIQEIIDAKPTDGLWEDNRTDEDQIGASYEQLEWAMSFNGSHEDLSDEQKMIYNIYNTLNKKNTHKIIPIPIFKRFEK